jgi:hypothetical protein
VNLSGIPQGYPDSPTASESTTIPLYERGGLNFRPNAEKAKARQCFNRCVCSRVQSTRFFGKQEKKGRSLKQTLPLMTNN